VSDVGLFLLLFAALLVLVGVIRFFAWLTELQEEHGSLPRAAGHAIERYVLVRPVNDFRPAAPVMSHEFEQTRADGQTDRQTDLVSEADQWLDRLEVDKTKTALIELLVYSGWDVGQIRGVVKGDNGAIGAEVEAARQRLRIVVEPRQLRVRDDQGERFISMEA
jgi:hypothetical protein